MRPELTDASGPNPHPPPRPQGQKYAYIDNVSVAPSSRRRGVATALLAAASRVAIQEFAAKEARTWLPAEAGWLRAAPPQAQPPLPGKAALSPQLIGPLAPRSSSRMYTTRTTERGGCTPGTGLRCVQEASLQSAPLLLCLALPQRLTAASTPFASAPQAPPLSESRQDGFDRAADRMGGLLLLVAPLPLRLRPVPPGACRCGGSEFGFECVCASTR